MTRIETRVHGIPMITLWYATESLKEKGIIIYRQAQFYPGGECTPFDTLFTDLTLSEEELLSRISKNGRYEIRRAAKEGVTAQMKRGKELTEKDIAAFCDFFIEFWHSKGVAYSGREGLVQEITAYAKQDQFVLSRAEIGGETCVYHTYILCDDKARLYHSASLYRVNEQISPKLIGMANRYLHHQDMLYFKKQGFAVYDWGGAGKNDEVKNITEFKESFGGAPARQYDFTRVNGIKAGLVTWLSRIRSKGNRQE